MTTPAYPIQSDPDVHDAFVRWQASKTALDDLTHERDWLATQHPAEAFVAGVNHAIHRVMNLELIDWLDYCAAFDAAADEYTESLTERIDALAS